MLFASQDKIATGSSRVARRAGQEEVTIAVMIRRLVDHYARVPGVPRFQWIENAEPHLWNPSNLWHLLNLYSALSASSGSTDAALRAGR